jgi:hypothetical protein
VSRRLTPKMLDKTDSGQGLRRTLYAAVRQVDKELVFMHGFLQLLLRMTQDR